MEQVNGDAAADEFTEKESRQTGRYKKVCITDPDASMSTNGRNRQLEPAYKEHAVVDDLRGVIVDVEVTTGETNEGQVVIERIDAAAATTGREVKTVTADAGYAYGKVYVSLSGAASIPSSRPRLNQSAAPCRCGVSDTTPSTTCCAVRAAKSCGRPGVSSTAVSSIPRPATARAARWPHSVCPRDERTRLWW